MCILIENAEDLTYLTANGRWTKRPEKGAGFASILAAYTAAKNESIGKFNIVEFFALNHQIINLECGSGKREVQYPAPLGYQAKASANEIGRQELATAISI